MKRKQQRKRITVRASHRAEPDIRKLSRALIDLAIAQAEADAEAAHHAVRGPRIQTVRQVKGDQT